MLDAYNGGIGSILNSSPTLSSSSISQTLTPQQLEAVSSNAHRLRVDAGAGTGKTTLLHHYAMARPGVPGIYLAFNKLIQLHAATRFPADCRPTTLHALAFDTFGRRYQQAGKLRSSAFHPRILRFFPETDSARRFIRARMALAAVNAYLVSDRKEFEVLSHVCVEAERLGVSASRLESDASLLFSSMANLDDDTPMTHDLYFKLWSMSDTSYLSKRFRYILVDETQDLSLAAHSVLSSQTVPLIYVGDSRQSIYGYRGTTDCFSSFDACITLHLDRSFRFGARIAAFTNQFLNHFNIPHQQLHGTASVDFVGPVQTDMPHAVLCRTNAGAFTAAVRSALAGRALSFVGGASGYGFARLRQAHHLLSGNIGQVTDPFLRSMRSIDQLRDYSKLVDDSELKSLCRVLREHGRDIPQLLSLIEARIHAADLPEAGSDRSAFEAKTFISTAHRAKGLEFPQVQVFDDFHPLSPARAHVSPSDGGQQEHNLLYVAMTRASMVLEPPGWLLALLHPATTNDMRIPPSPPPPPAQGSARIGPYASQTQDLYAF